MYGFVHLSAGDLLRAERNSGSKDAELINNIIIAGEIVPVEITVNLIKKAMKQHGWAKKKYLIDGFPRNLDNQEGWIKVMGDDVNMEFVLFFDCPEEVMLERIMSRAQKAAAGQQRVDDNLESVKKRFKTYVNQTMPIIDLYDK